MINVLAPINNTTGYGITSTNIWKELRKITDVNLFPIGGVALENETLRDDFSNDINNTMQCLGKHQPCIKIWHMHDLMSRTGNGKYGVLPFFEVDKLKDHEKASVGHADVIFTTCEWSKKVLVDNGLDSDSIVICPLAADHDIFNPKYFPADPNKTTYRFINIGKWEIRKSHDLLVHIFNEAFTKEDNAELWMVNHNPFLKPEQTEEWHNLYKNSKLGDKIKIFDRIPNHIDLAKVISDADCGVYISRAEGWNNEILETMAMNKPIIATNYSAHTAYCNNKNSYLVDVDSLEPASDGIWFDGFGKWAKLGSKQIEQAIEHMRYLYKNDIRTNQEGVNTSQSFTWQNTAKIIHKNLC